MLRKVMILVFVCCAAAAIDNCKKGGEYCLNHWDCCSNTCLSYLYQCSKVQQVQAQSSPALFAPAPISGGVRPETATLDALFELIFRPLKDLPQTGREVNEIQSRFAEEALGEPDLATLSPTTDGPTQCLEIGDKCYTNDDCCSKRCHGFLHQCVT